jgi:hypothetical protein
MKGGIRQVTINTNDMYGAQILSLLRENCLKTGQNPHSWGGSASKYPTQESREQSHL